jgi:hypothetical protein
MGCDVVALKIAKCRETHRSCSRVTRRCFVPTIEMVTIENALRCERSALSFMARRERQTQLADNGTRPGRDWPRAPFRAKRGDGKYRHSARYKKSLPGVRGLLCLFVELAALHDRRRGGARPDSGKIRQRQTVGHALRRRPLRGAFGQDRRRDLVRNLFDQAGSMPDLHAGRSRMRDGAAAPRPSGAGIDFKFVDL